MNGPARLDLHVHSRHSPDSRESLEAIVDRAVRIGLRGFALTDHNSIAGHAELATLQARRPELVLVPGVEVSTHEGHLLVYGVTAAPTAHRPIDETLRWVVEQGGVAVLAHPFRRFHGVGAAVARRVGVPAIETTNGHNGASANRGALAVASERGVGRTGGSDAHRALELGRATTRFASSVASVTEVLEELRAGRAEADGRGVTWTERIPLAFGTATRRLARALRPI